MATYMVRSGFSGAIPVTDVYYFVFMILISPMQILVFAMFFKEFVYDQFYRIYGHYKYNFSFTLVETEFVIIDYVMALFDFIFIYLPFENKDFVEHVITTIEGRNISKEAYNCYQVVLMQIIFFYYYKNSNIQIIYQLVIQLTFTLIGIAMIFDDDGLVGSTQLLNCPTLLLTLLYQVLLLQLRNFCISVLNLVIRKQNAELFSWYFDIEERLSYEMYEDINQTFSI